MSQDENQTKDTASMTEYKSSSWYDADAIDALKRRLDAYSTDYDTLKRQAEADYAPVYRSELAALQNQLASDREAAENERDALGKTYDRQRRLTNDAYDESAVRLSNALNARGLGRSSLTATQGAQLEARRNQALSDINASEADAADAINSRIAQLTQAAARSEQTLSSNYANQLESRINALKNSNQSAAVSLQLQIAALQQEGYEAYQNWLLKNRAQELDEAEYRRKYGLDDAQSTASSSGQATQKTSAASANSVKQSSGPSGLAAVGIALKSLLSRLNAGRKTGAADPGNRNVGPIIPTVAKRSLK